MRKKWTMEQSLRGQNQRAKQAGARHDLTMEQWLETLEYFDHKCAYCGGEHQVNTTFPFTKQERRLAIASLPVCISFYQNKNVIWFIESKGVKISFHIHKYQALKKNYVILCCEGCGESLDVPGLSIDEAQAYIDQYFVNTGYAYIESP